jgi:hypothetical protein
MSHWTRVNSKAAQQQFLGGSAAAVLGWLQPATRQGTAAGVATVRGSFCSCGFNERRAVLGLPGGPHNCKGPGMNASAVALVSKPPGKRST